MSILFTAIAAFTLVSAVAAMAMRSLIHCALCAALTFAGLAALFLHLGAQFVGFAQILVYVGAVAILIVFAILLTRGSEPSAQPILSGSAWGGFAVAGAVGTSLIVAAVRSPAGAIGPHAPPEIGDAMAVRQIGTQLMTEYVLPLEILALLLTAATIGAVIIAMEEKGPNS
ncbi:MAG: NADH-quinone oxidoreductase subunit J [Verrucomicrobiota bacterium]